MNENKKDILLNQVLKNIPKKALKVPIPDNYHIINTDNNNEFLIMIAKSDENSILQYLIDGKLENQESFEMHVEKVIEDTKKEMKDSTNIEFIEDYETNLFRFKLYIQNIEIKDLIIKQINAYFIEPESNFFYQVSLSSPPFEKNKINQEITDTLKDLIKKILSGIQYNKEIPPIE